MSPLRGEAKRPTYRILDRLSGGAASDRVFITHHEIFDGTFVQKTVYMHGLEDALAASEPAFLHRLDHPRIVPVREAQWDPDEERAITFVMPHLAGGSVAEALLEGYQFPLQRAIVITIDALDALAYVIREHHALHRDLKPGNVLLDEHRTHGYLADFGSAAQIDAAGGASAVLGTNIYRPPEARLSGRVDVRAEIYGIGMTLFEILNGRLPWEELDLEALEKRLVRGFRAVPESWLEFEPHVPDSLRRIVRKMIHRNPASRHPSPEAAITALRRLRCINWRRDDGVGCVGSWFGTWPPSVRPERQTEFRVTARELAGGTHRGSLRIESDQRRPGGKWRQALTDKTIGANDSASLGAYFAALEVHAAHRSPAR
jgi:eukaryotic-like serine/threonine-protein kinase